MILNNRQILSCLNFSNTEFDWLDGHQIIFSTGYMGMIRAYHYDSEGYHNVIWQTSPTSLFEKISEQGKDLYDNTPLARQLREDLLDQTALAEQSREFLNKIKNLSVDQLDMVLSEHIPLFSDKDWEKITSVAERVR